MAAGGPAEMVPALRSSRTLCVVADGYQDSCRGHADLRSLDAHKLTWSRVYNTHIAEQVPHTLLTARPPPHFSACPSHLLTAHLSSLLHIHPSSLQIHPFSIYIHPSLPHIDAPTSLHIHPSSFLHIHRRHLAAHAWPDTHNSLSIRTWLSLLLASLRTVRLKHGTAEAAGS